MSGGDCSSVKPQLMNVQKIVGSYGAFVAMKNDGSVVTWGNELFGGR